MMAMSNKKIGNDFEAFFCTELFSNGFWVHNFAQKQAGQPADVIAVKNGVAYLIDCKVCSRKGFALSRIEENQDTAMELWNATGNGVGWFALLVDEQIYMFTHKYLQKLRMITSVLSPEAIKTTGTPLEVWIKRCK